MKWVTAVILVITLGLTLRAIGILPINNYLINYPGYHVPYSNLGTRTINETTQARLEAETPNQVEALIIQSVGEHYFNDHFTDPQVEILDTTDGDWFAHAYYTYSYAIGNYSHTSYAEAWFNEKGELIHTEGIPRSDNLMPFKLTEQSARSIARYIIRYQGIPGDYTGSDAFLVYVGGYPLTPRIERYAWVVQYWRRLGSDAMGRHVFGETTTVIMDANTAWVYGSWTSRWEAFAD